MGRETSFGRTFRRHVTGVWVRIENSVSSGVPDLLGVVRGETVLVELKSLPQWEGTLGLSPVQRAWQKRWVDAGGRAYTLVKVERVVYLVRGDRLLGAGTRQEWSEVASYCQPQARVNWDTVKRCLTSKI